jgi:mannose-1-phosphate guanylyltransferase
MPKQFLDILNTGKSLIQWTYERYALFIPKENIYVVTSSEYENIVAEQLPDLNRENIVCEPSRKTRLRALHTYLLSCCKKIQKPH